MHPLRRPPPLARLAHVALIARVARALLICTLAVGCGRFFPAPVPMRALDYPAPRPQARCLVVFLPGMGDGAEEFQTHGFVDELRRRGLAVDMVAAHATIGYYSRGTFVDRLSRDVLEPRRARGYAHTWLIGPSMGGFGTLFYSRMRTPDVTGVLALAPFLGDRDIVDEVRRSGGLRKWTAPPRVDVPDDSNYQREMWRWLQAATQGREPAPALYMGFGRADDLASTDDLLAAELPPDHVYRVDGGHKWDPWRSILIQFLDRGPLAQDCR